MISWSYKNQLERIKKSKIYHTQTLKCKFKQHIFRGFTYASEISLLEHYLSMSLEIDCIVLRYIKNNVRVKWEFKMRYRLLNVVGCFSGTARFVYFPDRVVVTLYARLAEAGKGNIRTMGFISYSFVYCTACRNWLVQF